MRIVCSGGGTGGHIFPAVAVAREIKKRYPSSEVLFIGANGKMEMEKVPKAGFPIKGLWISGIQRRLTLQNLSWPFKVISSVLAARKILKEFKPDVVAGFGGYASGAALWAAAQMKIPTLIQEQNSYAGITNKILSKKVDTVCLAYEEASQFFPGAKVVITGNPIRALRANAISKEKAVAKLGLASDKKTVLIIGGSLGARSINRAMRSLHGELSVLSDIQIIWQCGSLYHEEYKDCDTAQLEHVHIKSFIEDMDVAYASADLVACRSGALTISEVQGLGKAAVLIPSPNVAEDHQTKNANALVKHDAAVMLEDKVVDQDFVKVIHSLLSDEERLEGLRKNALSMAKPKATEVIVDELEALINRN